MVKNLPADTGDTRDTGSIPQLGRSPGVGNQPTPVFLPEKFHGQRIPAGHSPWGHKESDVTEQLGTHTTLSIKKVPVSPH